MERNKSIDGLKYLLIILVIVGHFIEPSRYNNIISCHTYSFIYSFHMPLFIMLNGYLYRKRQLKEEIKKCTPLLEVCILSHILFAILKYGELSYDNMIDFSFTPSWYLLSLVCWRIQSSVLAYYFSDKKILILSITIEIISFLLFTIYGGTFSIMRTMQFYPFFMIGYFLKKNAKHTITKYAKSLYYASMFAIIYILITSCRLQHQCFFERAGLLELSNFTKHGLLWLYIFRYSLILSSLFISLSIFLISQNNRVVCMLSKYGKSTLFIFYGQTLIYPLATKYCTTISTSLILSALSIIILTKISYYPMSEVLMTPITYIKRILNKY